MPVTHRNFDRWWKCVRNCVLERWSADRSEYDKALRKIGCEKEEEWKRRAMALDRVKQALKSLANLRKDESQSRTITGTTPGQP